MASATGLPGPPPAAPPPQLEHCDTASHTAVSDFGVDIAHDFSAWEAAAWISVDHPAYVAASLQHRGPSFPPPGCATRDSSIWHHFRPEYFLRLPESCKTGAVYGPVRTVL